jgi:hypothetical protein
VRAIKVYWPGATPEKAKPVDDTIARGIVSAPDATRPSMGEG